MALKRRSQAHGLEARRAGRGTACALHQGVYRLASCHLASNPSGVLTQLGHAGFHVSAEKRGAGGTVGGGDFYTLAVRAPGHIGVVIGDACGRGEDGEAQLSRILPKVHQLALSGASPAELLTELNRTVATELAADRFVTAAAFEFDIGAGLLTVANAAHVPAMVRRARDRRVSIVGRASGMPLGILESTTYLDERYELNRGDVIVLMTDGVLEAVESDLLSMSTLKRFLAEASDGAGGVHRFLLRKFEECTRGKSADDMTLMALEAMPEPISGSLSEFARAS
jgi:serine phosphatase RsbU (regulator of sigma subunit)